MGQIWKWHEFLMFQSPEEIHAYDALPRCWRCFQGGDQFEKGSTLNPAVVRSSLQICKITILAGLKCGFFPSTSHLNWWKQSMLFDYSTLQIDRHVVKSISFVTILVGFYLSVSFWTLLLGGFLCVAHHGYEVVWEWSAVLGLWRPTASPSTRSQSSSWPASVQPWSVAVGSSISPWFTDEKIWWYLI